MKDEYVVAGMFASVFLLVVIAFAAALKEAEAWTEYAVNNDCKVVSTRQVQEVYTIPNDDGYPINHTTTATYSMYECADGTMHERKGGGGLW